MKRMKRVIALIGVVLFVSSAPMTAYAKADNFVLNTGAVVELITSAFASTPHGATVVLLGMLGITIGGAIGENLDTEAILDWGQKRMDELYRFIDNAGEELSITKDAMGMWLTDVGNGMLDTTSECWDAFLDYCCWLDGEVSSSSSGTSDITWTSVDGVQEFIDAHSSDFVGGIDCPLNTNYRVELSSLTKSVKSVSFSDIFYFTDDFITFVKLPYDGYQVFVTSLDFDVSDIVGTGAFSSVGSSNPFRTYVNYEEGVYPVFCTSEIWYDGRLSDTAINKWSPYVDRWLDLSSFTCAPQIWKSKGLYGLVSGIAIGWDGWCVEVPDVTPKEDVSDVIVAPDTSGIIDRDGDLDNVRVGDATGELVGVIGIPVDGIGLGEVATPYVGVPGVYPVDTVTGEIVGTDTPIEDVTPEKVPTINGAYTIDGLEDVFPFCVPFDLIDLFSVLSAEPQAPKFKFPLPVPDGNMKFHYEYIEIDLSKFDAAAKVLRAMELLAFCIGLTLVTRKLIRG